MKANPRAFNGPPAECCGRPTLWWVQGGPSRTTEVPANDPPTFFAAGPWQCQVERAHRGPWIHTTTDPAPYLAHVLRRAGLA